MLAIWDIANVCRQPIHQRERLHQQQLHKRVLLRSLQIVVTINVGQVHPVLTIWGIANAWHPPTPQPTPQQEPQQEPQQIPPLLLHAKHTAFSARQILNVVLMYVRMDIAMDRFQQIHPRKHLPTPRELPPIHQQKLPQKLPQELQH